MNMIWINSSGINQHIDILSILRGSVHSDITIPEMQGGGKTATAIYELAEQFATIEQTLEGLIDNTIEFLKYTDSAFIQQDEAIGQIMKQ